MFVSHVLRKQSAPLSSWVCLSVYCALLSIGFFIGGIWAGLGIGLALVLTLISWLGSGSFPRPDKRFLLLAVSFLVGSALLTLQSSVPESSWRVWLNLVTIFLPLLLLSSRTFFERAFAPRFYEIIAVLVIISALIMTSELLDNGYFLHYFKGKTANINKYNRPLCHAILMSFPIMAALWNSRYRRWTVLFFIAILLPTIFTPSGSAQLALMAGTIVMVLAHYVPRFTKILLSAGIWIAIGVPFLARAAFAYAYPLIAALPASWHHRAEIWDYISYRIMDKPLLGWGLGSSRTLSVESPHRLSYITAKVAAAHPHNMMSQIWVELGLFGLIAGLIFFHMTLQRAAALPAQIRNFALAAWAAAFTISLFGFSFWTDSLFAAFALTAFAFAGVQQRLQHSFK